jgi:hypothetical protein
MTKRKEINEKRIFITAKLGQRQWPPMAFGLA